jgi:hypothetical protein
VECPTFLLMTKQKQRFWRRIENRLLLLILLPIILPLALLALVLYVPHRLALYMLVWVLWLPRGKNVLLVYSDSPIWHEYMLTEVMPPLGKHAIVLNWSERSKWPWWSFRVHVFHCFAGDREFNPLVVLFRPFRRARVFRFWSAFKEWKRGDKQTVERLRQQLLSAL